MSWRREIKINPFAAIDAEAIKDDQDFAHTAISILVNFLSALCHPGSEPSDPERSVLTSSKGSPTGQENTSGG
ncbi:hypothetical protein AB8880_04680 [Alphaproteobacteria bacterium LSUCC0684]